MASQGPGSAGGGSGAVDPGTALPGDRAPRSPLPARTGARVSLSQFRGRAVVLAFVDARCTTVCPLTTASMTQAVSLLGATAARHVKLLGIDANPDAFRVADVRAYSAAHQMMRSWDFLTGSERQLAAVWRAYHVYVAASHGGIDHEPAVYLIDAQGRECTLYLTQMAYATIAQQAQLLADGLSRILPGHPVPRRAAGLRPAPSIRPRTDARLPVTGGTRTAPAEIGPGHPHLVVFLASWLSEVSDLPRQLQALDTYQREAARNGWPAVLVIDETAAESTPHALARCWPAPGRSATPSPLTPAAGSPTGTESRTCRGSTSPHRAGRSSTATTADRGQAGPGGGPRGSAR